MITITEQLSERLNTALVKIGKETLPSNFRGTVSAAADTRFGDYQTNAAMILAKKFGISNDPEERSADEEYGEEVCLWLMSKRLDAFLIEEAIFHQTAIFQEYPAIRDSP